MTIVPYHIEHGDHYPSLAYVHETRDSAKSACEDYDGIALVRAIELEGTTYYGQYTSTFPDETERTGKLASYGHSTQVVTKGLITVFDIIDETHEPTWYKELEREGIADAVQRTEWRQSIAETGGQLISELILRHALPNANHRTSIGFLELYLRTFGELPRIPETGSPEGWSEWANEYIMESKRLLTTRRKSNLFKHIENLGATGVMRKHGVKIDFARYDPDVSNPLREYARRHRSASVSFVREYLDRAGVPERGNKSDKGLRVCAARLE